MRSGALRFSEGKPLRPVHRLDAPTGLSLCKVASPQCRFRFARQNHCDAAATSAANFRMRRDLTNTQEDQNLPVLAARSRNGEFKADLRKMSWASIKRHLCQSGSE